LERTGRGGAAACDIVHGIEMVGARHEHKNTESLSRFNGMIEWNQRLPEIAHPTKSTEAILFLNEQPGQRPSYDTSISS
jgi:hypothetical protein